VAFLPVGHISLDNYTGVFDTVPAARFLINSIFITALTVIFGLFVNSMAAFALSRMQLPAAQRPMRTDHGLLHADHHSGADILSGLPAHLRQQHRLGRRQGMNRCGGIS
jgi:hypothetical protein